MLAFVRYFKHTSYRLTETYTLYVCCLVSSACKMSMDVGPYRQLDTAGSLTLVQVVKFVVLHVESPTG